MVFYFTATGNSLYVAKQLEDTPISIAQALHDIKRTYTADQIGIVCPVFGHEVPVLVKKFLEQSVFETPYFYMILTYGNRHGGAAELTENMLLELGIRPSYIQIVLMVDNFLPAFDMNQQKTLDKKVDAQIQKIKEDLAAGKKEISPVTEEDRAVHQAFLERMKKMPFGDLPLYHITEECIGCGICQKVCPMGCFTVKNQKSVWNPEGCITCMACIHACPMMAIQLNMPEKNPHARYRNENISICEIVDANNQRKQDTMI